MKKLYVIVPFVGVLIFGIFYWTFQSKIEAKEKAKHAEVEKARQKKIQEDVASRKQAYDDAIALAEQRKKEREVKDAREKAEKEAEQKLTDDVQLANGDLRKQAEKVKRLKEEITEEKTIIEKIQNEKTLSIAEETFLRDYVKQAEANSVGLEDVLKKIEQADRAAQAAAEAAAKAAAAKKS